MPLPSRRERCEFTLRPLSHTVKDFLKDIQEEDKGIERAMVYNEDGSRISGSTGVDVLLQSNFNLVLNEDSYLVSVPDESKCCILVQYSDKFMYSIVLYSIVLHHSK